MYDVLYLLWLVLVLHTVVVPVCTRRIVALRITTTTTIFCEMLLCTGGIIRCWHGLTPTRRGGAVHVGLGSVQSWCMIPTYHVYHQSSIIMMYRCIDVSQHVPIMFNVSIMFHIANRGYQGEVGLLSRTRTITVSSEVKDSELTDPDPLTCTQGRWCGVGYKGSLSGQRSYRRIRIRRTYYHSRRWMVEKDIILRGWCRAFSVSARLMFLEDIPSTFTFSSSQFL